MQMEFINVEKLFTVKNGIKKLSAYQIICLYIHLMHEKWSPFGWRWMESPLRLVSFHLWT